MADLLLELREASVDLDGHGRGVREVSLEIAGGEVGALIGGRDAGKTTLLRLAGGMLRPQEGKVLFAGRDLYGLSEAERSRLLARDVAWACRTGPGGLQLSMLDYVGLPLVAGRKLSRLDRRRLAREALSRMEVAECEKLSWLELSEWQRVCVELAQAIVRGPSLLLIDGLIGGLSTLATNDALRLVRYLADDENLAVLIAGDEFELCGLAERVWSIEAGKVWQMGEPLPRRESAPVIDLDERRRSADA